MPVRCRYKNKGIFILAAIVLDVQSGPKSNFFLPFMGTVTRLRKLKPGGMAAISLSLLRGSTFGAWHPTRSRSRPRPTQLCTESDQPLCGERVEERFQEHLRLAKAGIEVVVERIELFPTGGGFNGQPRGNVVGVLFKLHSEMFDSVREDAELMKKT